MWILLVNNNNFWINNQEYLYSACRCSSCRSAHSDWVPVSVGYPQMLLWKLLFMFMQVCSYEFFKSCRQGNLINELKTLITLRNNLVKLTCYTIKNLIIKKWGGEVLAYTLLRGSWILNPAQIILADWISRGK